MAASHLENNLPHSIAIENVLKKISATNVNAIKIHHTWEIPNFSSLEIENEALSSTPFSGGVTDKYKWRLIIYQTTPPDQQTDYLSVCLEFMPTVEIDEVLAKCELKIVDINDDEGVHRSTGHILKFSRAQPVKKFVKFIETEYLFEPANGYLRENILTIDCDITIFRSIANHVTECNSEVSQEDEYLPMLKFISGLFESPQLCDVTLVTCGRKIQAHKLILAARSSVFATMFKHDMKEKLENEVNIYDVDYNVLFEMVRFIYTGKTSNLGEVADRLLAAADKYALQTLKNQCEEELCKSITVANTANLLILSDLHNAVTLKSQVVDFLCTHAEEVIKTTNYKSLHVTHPHLIDDALQAFAKKNPNM